MSVDTFSVLITGGTSGLGLACAKRIHALCPNYTLLVTGRNTTQGAQAVKEIKEQQPHSGQAPSDTPSDEVHFLPLDLLSQADVRRFAHAFTTARYPALISLVLNAGMQTYDMTPHTVDGHAAVFATNHLNQFLLFELLRPHFAPHIHIVVTSSGTHDPKQKTGFPDPVYVSGERLAHPAKPDDEKGLITYSTSKLCNVYFTYELHRRARASGQSLQVNAMDPGLMPGTGLARSSAVINFLAKRVLPHLIPLLRVLLRNNNVHTAQESSVALTRLAIDPTGDLGTTSGKYFAGLEETTSSDLSYNEANAKELWESSIQLTAKDDAERQVFKMQ